VQQKKENKNDSPQNVINNLSEKDRQEETKRQKRVKEKRLQIGNISTRNTLKIKLNECNEKHSKRRRY